MVKLRANIHIPFVILFCLIVIGLFTFVSSFIKTTLNAQAKNQFKTVYADYTGALNQTVNDFYGETKCFLSADKYYPSDFSGCAVFYKRFVKNLDPVKYCPDYAQDRGCMPKYKKYATRHNCAGFSQSMMEKFSKGYQLSDNSSMVIFNMPSNLPNPIMAIDVNGAMPPNKAGYDLFSLVIMRNKSGSYYFHPNITYCLPVDKGSIQYLSDIYK